MEGIGRVGKGPENLSGRRGTVSRQTYYIWLRYASDVDNGNEAEPFALPCIPRA